MLKSLELDINFYRITTSLSDVIKFHRVFINGATGETTLFELKAASL